MQHFIYYFVEMFNIATMEMLLLINTDNTMPSSYAARPPVLTPFLFIHPTFYHVIALPSSFSAKWRDEERKIEREEREPSYNLFSPVR